jgi:hypothetical protein
MKEIIDLMLKKSDGSSSRAPKGVAPSLVVPSGRDEGDPNP